MTDLTIDKRLLAEYDTNSQRQVRIDACLWCISNQRHALYPSETIVNRIVYRRSGIWFLIL